MSFLLYTRNEPKFILILRHPDPNEPLLTMTTRAHRAWRDAWYSFRIVVWNQLEEPGWCGLSLVLQIYRQEKTKVLDALRREFDDLSWWEIWTQWNDQYEQLLPTSEEVRRACPSFPLPSELPPPPEEPKDLWARTMDLWSSEDQMLAIGGAVIRLVLARGRATREIRGD